MKRIFKKVILVFWCCITGFTFFILPHTYVMAQDDEDIEWLDDEDEEVGSLQLESDMESAKSLENGNKDEDVKWLDDEDEEVGSLQPESDMESAKSAKDRDKVEKEIESADSSSDKETTTENSISDTETVTGEDSSSGPETVIEGGLSYDSGIVDEYEQSLYETYVQYYSKRVPMGEWANVIGGKDIYIVQQKDTLWDVSKVLFGDSSYWPKLWSANPGITNPHLIQPGDNLGFIYGTEETPPSLSIITSGKDGTDVKASTPPPVPDFLKNKKIVEPPYEKKVKPVMRFIPASLPPLYLSDKQETSVSDMDIGFKKIDIPTVGFLHYYMSDEPIFGQGIISDNKDYGSVFHVGQRVILEMRDPVNPGQENDRNKKIGVNYILLLLVLEVLLGIR